MSEQNRIQVHPIPAFRDNYIWAHIAYYGSKMVFCGDTPFACGCGRVFEGTPPQMHASLQSWPRCGEPEVVRSASRRGGAPITDPVEVFTAIREWKNTF